MPPSSELSNLCASSSVSHTRSAAVDLTGTERQKYRPMSSASTSKRGYGWKHQKLRNRWAREVARGEVDCARCGEPIWPEEYWDLGHVDGDKSHYAGPEHRACNPHDQAPAPHASRHRR